MRGLAGMLAGMLRTSIGVIPGMRLLDRFAGLVLGLVAGVFLCWAIGAVLLYLPGETELRRSVQRSLILSEINDVVPPERLLEELERVDPIGVFLGPPAIVAPPDKGLAKDPDVVRASKSVVRVTGVACGLGVEGSGWVAKRGLVVTNAHVVAGIRNPRVDTAGGRAFVSTVVAFDSTNDLAVLRVPGLGAPRARARASRSQHAGRARRLSAERAAHADAGAARRDSRGPQPRRVRPRAGDAAGHDDPRVGRSPGARAAPVSTPRDTCARPSSPARPRETGGYGIPADLVQKVLAQVASATRRRHGLHRPRRRDPAPRAAAGTAG